MATRQESLDLFMAWFIEMRSDINKLQGMLEPIQNGWAYKTSFDDLLPMSAEQRQTHINNGLAVIQHLQALANAVPDASGFLE